MSPRALAPLVAVAALLLVVLIIWFAFAAPAGDDLVVAQSRAQIQISEAEGRLPELVGRAYADDLESASYAYDKEARKVRKTLTDRAAAMGQWFPEFTTLAAGQVPSGPSYAQRYAFNRDELGRALWAAFRGSSGRDIEAFLEGDFALADPAFVADGRDPSAEEVVDAQLRFNLQRRLLLAAAAEGAFSRKAPEFTPGWAARTAASGRFVEDKLVLHFLVASRSVPAVLRALLAASTEGPTVRLLGLDLRARPIPTDLREGHVPPVELRVSLALTVFRAANGG